MARESAKLNESAMFTAENLQDFKIKNTPGERWNLVLFLSIVIFPFILSQGHEQNLQHQGLPIQIVLWRYNAYAFFSSF